MIKENYAFIILDAAYLAILPGIAIMLLVLAFMLVGNALRDALDVKTKANTLFNIIIVSLHPQNQAIRGCGGIGRRARLRI